MMSLEEMRGDARRAIDDAVFDPTTVARLEVAGIDPYEALADNDSETAREALGDAIRTGPTGTNVSDVTLVLTAPHTA